MKKVFALIGLYVKALCTLWSTEKKLSKLRNKQLLNITQSKPYLVNKQGDLLAAADFETSYVLYEEKKQNGT